MDQMPWRNQSLLLCLLWQASIGAPLPTTPLPGITYMLLNRFYYNLN